MTTIKTKHNWPVFTKTIEIYNLTSIHNLSLDNSRKTYNPHFSLSLQSCILTFKNWPRYVSICAIDIKQRFNAQSNNPRNHIRAVPQRDQNGRFVKLYELRQLDNSKTIPGLSHLIFAH